jgi:hypothetical protein
LYRTVIPPRPLPRKNHAGWNERHRLSQVLRQGFDQALPYLFNRESKNCSSLPQKVPAAGAPAYVNFHPLYLASIVIVPGNGMPGRPFCRPKQWVCLAANFVNDCLLASTPQPRGGVALFFQVPNLRRRPDFGFQVLPVGRSSGAPPDRGNVHLNEQIC